jgi:transcriptional regulator with XRE-family HTH domain
MQVAVEIRIFNHPMRQARRAMGWTQERLASEAHCSQWEISAIETMRLPSGSFLAVRERLARIARALEVDFDVLFPEEYLRMIEDKFLPRRRETFVWIREVGLEQLTSRDRLALTDYSLTEVERDDRDQDLHDLLKEMLEELPQSEQYVLIRRFGLDGNLSATREAIGLELGITSERVRQIEANAMRYLRHPRRSRRLCDFLEDTP